MNNIRAFFSGLLFLFMASISCLAQPGLTNDHAILDSGKRIQTEVFELDTREPTQLSLIRKYDDNRFIRRIPARRLEMPANRLSAFLISHINPLRYSYYINNQLVTQFMDANSFNSPGNTFINGAYLPVSDINTIEIIKISSDNTNQRAQLLSIRNEMTNSKFALEKRERNLTRLYYQLEEKFDSTSKYSKKEVVVLNKRISELQGKIKQEELSLSESADSFAVKIATYEQVISEMNINNRNQEIIYQIAQKFHPDNVSVKEMLLRETEKEIGVQAAEYRQMNENLDSALIYFQLLSYNSVSPIKGNILSFSYNNSFSRRNQNEYFDRFIAILNRYGYSSSYLTTIKNENYAYNSTKFQLEGLSIREFITNQKFLQLESFILTTCVNIGKLLQTKHADYSRKLNSVKDKDYISKEDLDEIDLWQQELIQIFSFIQDISTDFSVLTKYLEIDNSNFKDILTNINTYYLQLLSFLKNFDYLLNANTTTEFTLATSTNLSNIDLVRYNIEREDKVTKGKQTYVYDIWLRGGLKIDFSAGIFSSGLVDLSYSKVQLLRPDSSLVTGDTFAVKKQNTGSFNFSFGGMVNIYPRLGASWITIGASVGVAYSDNQKLQFLLGGSLHFGKTERLILHGGIAMGLIKTIDLSAFPYVYDNKNQQYLIRGSMNAFNIPLIDKFSVRPFIGLSYNLSKKNALMAVSGQGLDKYNGTLNRGTGK